MITAKVVADSANNFGDRLTTMVVTFPRYILAELNTHRMFSRNSASSRAIPFDKMVKMVEENPFIPHAWMKDHKGMQGTDFVTKENIIDFRTGQWLQARDYAVECAKRLHSQVISTSGGSLGLWDNVPHLNAEDGEPITKQMCNRFLEPFMWHTVIITSSEWENFFSLRCPQYRIPILPEDADCPVYRSWKDAMNGEYTGDFVTDNLLERFSYNGGQADIHMMLLAEAMWDAYNENEPKQLEAGEWHIPFGDGIDYIGLQRDLGAKSSFECDELKVKIATARCARVSYTVVGEESKEADYPKDVELHDRLLKAKHASPFEHIAITMPDSGRYANFYGFKQYRTILEENGSLQTGTR